MKYGKKLKIIHIPVKINQHNFLNIHVTFLFYGHKATAVTVCSLCTVIVPYLKELPDHLSLAI